MLMCNDFPNDPVILLSFINTQLRDHYSSFEALCEDFDADAMLISSKLKSIDYEYNPSRNQFV